VSQDHDCVGLRLVGRHPVATLIASAQHAPDISSSGLHRALQDDVTVDAEGPGRVNVRRLAPVPGVQVGIWVRVYVEAGRLRSSSCSGHCARAADLEAARLAALVMARHDRCDPRARACAGSYQVSKSAKGTAWSLPCSAVMQ